MAFRREFDGLRHGFGSFSFARYVDDQCRLVGLPASDPFAADSDRVGAEAPLELRPARPLEFAKPAVLRPVLDARYSLTPRISAGVLPSALLASRRTDASLFSNRSLPRRPTAWASASRRFKSSAARAR